MEALEYLQTLRQSLRGIEAGRLRKTPTLPLERSASAAVAATSKTTKTPTPTPTSTSTSTRRRQHRSSSAFDGVTSRGRGRLPLLHTTAASPPSGASVSRPSARRAGDNAATATITDSPSTPPCLPPGVIVSPTASPCAAPPQPRAGDAVKLPFLQNRAAWSGSFIHTNTRHRAPTKTTTTTSATATATATPTPTPTPSSATPAALAISAATRTTATAAQLTVATDQAAAAQTHVRDLITDYTSQLPVQWLFERNPAHPRVLQVVRRALVRLNHFPQRKALRKWQLVFREAVHTERNTAASRIQAAWRSFRKFRTFMKTLLRAFAEHAESEELQLRSVLVLQRWWRGHTVRAAERVNRAAACKVCRWYAWNRSRRMFSVDLFRRMRCRLAATRIQCVWRGGRGRTRATALRHAANARRFQARLVSSDAKAFKLVLHGAATVVQTWWRASVYNGTFWFKGHVYSRVLQRALRRNVGLVKYGAWWSAVKQLRRLEAFKAWTQRLASRYNLTPPTMTISMFLLSCRRQTCVREMLHRVELRQMLAPPVEADSRKTKALRWVKARFKAYRNKDDAARAIQTLWRRASTVAARRLRARARPQWVRALSHPNLFVAVWALWARQQACARCTFQSICVAKLQRRVRRFITMSRVRTVTRRTAAAVVIQGAVRRRQHLKHCSALVRLLRTTIPRLQASVRRRLAVVRYDGLRTTARARLEATAFAIRNLDAIQECHRLRLAMQCLGLKAARFVKEGAANRPRAQRLGRRSKPWLRFRDMNYGTSAMVSRPASNVLHVLYESEGSRRGITPKRVSALLSACPDLLLPPGRGGARTVLDDLGCARVKFEDVQIVVTSSRADRTRVAGLAFSEFVAVLNVMASNRYPSVTACEGFEGSAARVVVFLRRCLLPSPLGAKLWRKVTSHVCNDLDMAARAIQAVWRPAVRRMRSALLSSRSMTRRQHMRAEAAVVRLQAMWRRHLVRRRVLVHMRALYTRFHDEESGTMYYLNLRTQEMTWEPPRLLFGHNLLPPVLKPRAQYIAYCAECAVGVATVVCKHCAIPYCDACAVTSHDRFPDHVRAKHVMAPVQLCSECGFQAAARHCSDCADDFCDACFKSIHAAGAWHDYSHILEPCSHCDDAAAVIRCWECDSRDGSLLCGGCWYLRHPAHDPALARHSHYEPHPYQTSTMADRLVALALQAKVEERLEMERRHKQAIKQARETRAAIAIQGFWRLQYAFKLWGRAIAANFANMKARRADDKIRATLGYKLRYMFRCHPVLRSETANDAERRDTSLFRQVLNSNRVRRIRGRLSTGQQQLKGTVAVFYGSSWVLPQYELHRVLSAGQRVVIHNVVVKLARVEPRRIMLAQPYTGPSDDQASMTVRVGTIKAQIAKSHARMKRRARRYVRRTRRKIMRKLICSRGDARSQAEVEREAKLPGAKLRAWGVHLTKVASVKLLEMDPGALLRNVYPKNRTTAAFHAARAVKLYMQDITTRAKDGKYHNVDKFVDDVTCLMSMTLKHCTRDAPEWQVANRIQYQVEKVLADTASKYARMDEIKEQEKADKARRRTSRRRASVQRG